MAEVSVVICTVNRPELIGGAVSSVLSGTLTDIELVVVDQSPGSETKVALEAFSDDTRLIYIHSDRVGLSAAYNTGIDATSAPVIAFTDDDCIAGSDWAESVQRAFARFPAVDLLYGQVKAPPDLDVGSGVLPTLEIGERRLLATPQPFQPFGMGANFAARRGAMAALDGFDEVLGGGGPLRSSQDFDLQYRAYRAGMVCLLEPTVSVLHYGLRQRHQWGSTLAAYGEGDGGFYMKHIRCGDLTATRLFASKLGRELLRSAAKPVLRRPHSRAYLKGLLAGAAHSFQHPIHRGPRIYQARTGQ